jgi:hypothetical protein
MGWIELLSSKDFEGLWSKLYVMVANNPSAKGLYAHSKMSYDQLKEAYADLTQDVFLKLLKKDRWQFYQDSGYKDKDIEHELSHIEIPNLVGGQLRQRFPEAFRLARRVSNLLSQSGRYRKYPSGRLLSSDGTKSGQALGKRVYGLREWPLDKPVKDERQFHVAIREVSCRARNTKRAGRGSTSQVIISNDELAVLLTDKLVAIDSPADVRTLVIEDSVFTSIEDETIAVGGSEGYALKRDFADSRPTPEEVLTQKEFQQHVNALVASLLERLLADVNYKPRRYRTLMNVIWHCYFDSAASSQTRTARLLGVSNSLIVHYRKIFESSLKDIQLSPDEWIIFNVALKNRVARALKDIPQPMPAPVEKVRAFTAAAR